MDLNSTWHWSRTNLVRSGTKLPVPAADMAFDGVREGVQSVHCSPGRPAKGPPGHYCAVRGVDFENVQQVDLSHLHDNTNVIIFVGASQKAVPIELVTSAEPVGVR